MPPVAVVTDSTAYLPQAALDRHHVRVVSLYVVFGGDRTVRETEVTDLPAFFEELRSAESLPTTSQPSMGDFAAVYEPLLANGGEVVSVHISSRLSGTSDAARQAAAVLAEEGKGGERVRVIDSRTAAGGLGLMVLVAARSAEGGADAEEVERTVEAARGDLKMWFALDTLEFLKRGGRIGAARAWIGSTMRIKPILTVESELTPVERVRTSGRMLERLVDYARQRHASGADAWAVQHINAPDQCARLLASCRDIFGSEPVLVSEVGAVLSAHTGPGLLGVGSIPTRYLA